jgi:hypothetical protein
MTARAAKKPDVDEAIAILIACTRRKQRPKSIVEIARLIEFLRQELRSYKSVSDAIGISTEMLREFRSVEKLEGEVRSLVENRTIDSVDLVYRISKLNSATQRAVVREVLGGRMMGDDVRVVRSLSRSHISPEDVVTRVMESRDVKTYVIKFPTPVRNKANQLRNTFRAVVGDDEIVSFDIEDGTGTIELTYRGQQNLRRAAKRAGMTLRRFVTSLLEESSRKR